MTGDLSGSKDWLFIIGGFHPQRRQFQPNLLERLDADDLLLLELLYKQAMDVAVHFEQIVAGFSRYHKYTLGTELRNTSREIVGIIIQANSARDKQPDLLRLRERLEALLVLMRLAKEVRAFKSFNAYVHAVEIVGSVPRQNEGWLRSVTPGTSRK